MDYDEMLGRVATSAGLEKHEAEQVTRAFLETLSRRIGNDEARQLASQLPVELQDTLHDTRPDVEKFSPQDLISRVAGGIGFSPGRADQAVRAVWRTLGEAVSPEELQDVRSHLPNEFIELLEESSGEERT